MSRHERLFRVHPSGVMQSPLTLQLNARQRDFESLNCCIQVERHLNQPNLLQLEEITP